MTMPILSGTARRTAGAATALLLGLALAGCGSLAESVTERAVEEAAEAANGGGDVDLDINDEDGSISISSSEGSFSVGGSQELPDGFPAELPLPADHEVVSSMSFDDGGDASYNISMSVAGDADTVAAELQASLEDTGYTLTGTSEMQMDGLDTRTMQFEGDGLEGFITVADTPDGTVANYTVQSGGDA
ncbi:hypothetical protein [Salsipaludibacter albus]|uniref:hypothetical protein n=1 Tax=Salsipaludibacter albus TaxID=2849650 RepID=UPI001EE451BF|nr:hypothetical protein [Salsipaludibacter albus]MBY5163527.1 hypothetical protein [Salsipaludibacter albus]